MTLREHQSASQRLVEAHTVDPREIELLLRVDEL